ncbi:MAG: delta 1-pyrroline-5-carboxylate synthetase [Candidatus Helarchaeota archaeon]|nr:delta 1-pyrroline-5-carboxylate synthetase [Candidatus Helarchaeota archaeon]
MDAVIKIGGSVLQKGTIKELCKTLDSLAVEYSLVIVPGGGDYANQVRNYYQTFQLSETTAHWMAIFTENILGFLLLEYMDVGVPAFSISEIVEASENSKIPVFMPFQHLFKQDPLPHSWDVTSDSIAAYIAESLGAQKLILLKDVDGIYTRDPKKFHGKDVRLIPEIDLKKDKLADFHSCIDKYLPSLLEKYNRSCYIVNGLHPERLVKVMKNQKTINTLIKI